MRRPGLVTLVVAGALGGVGPAEAQSLTVEARAGAAFPLGDLKDVADIGFTIGGAGAWFFHPNIGVRADILAELLNDVVDPFGIVPAPPLTLIHFTGGFEVDFAPAADQATPLSFRLHLGAGGTRVDGAQQYGDGSSVEISATYPTFTAGTAIGYRMHSQFEVFVDGTLYLILFDEADTEMFAERSRQASAFSEAWSYPVTMGVRLIF